MKEAAVHLLEAPWGALEILRLVPYLASKAADFHHWSDLRRGWEIGDEPGPTRLNEGC